MELEKAGLPAGVMISSAFIGFGTMQLKSLGIPGAPIFEVPHPFRPLTADGEALDKLVDKELANWVGRLTGGPGRGE